MPFRSHKKYAIFSIVVTIVTIIIAIIDLFFGGDFYISREGIRFVRGIVNRDSIDEVIALSLLILLAQFSIFFVLIYQKKEHQRFGISENRMATCYYCTILQVLMLLGSMLEDVTIIRGV